MDEKEVEAQPERIGSRLLTVIVPSWNNLDLLVRMVNSILQYTALDPSNPWYHVLVVNNGDPGSVHRGSPDMGKYPLCTVLDAGSNLGWEGGLAKGLEWVNVNTKSKYVMFANDDIQIIPSDLTWVHKMLDVMENDETVAAVGPVSNMVSGGQNFSHMLDAMVHETKMLIGLCMAVRRDALEQVGGIVLGLPGGDDIDLSLRLAGAGWRLAIHGGVYVHHWGEATGKRVYKDYWNSLEMISTTRNEMIRRHGLKAYLAMLRFAPTPLIPPVASVSA